jgi:hypothetical protein
MSVLDAVSPLQATTAQAESWHAYLTGCQEELRGPRALDAVARAENAVGIGAGLGELLPSVWRAAFHGLLRPLPGTAPWTGSAELETTRRYIRALFYKVREAMEAARKTAEMVLALTGRPAPDAERLLQAMEQARALEERVFQGWPSFSGPPPGADALDVDAALAETLGVTVEEARQRLDARRSCTRPE